MSFNNVRDAGAVTGIVVTGFVLVTAHLLKAPRPGPDLADRLGVTRQNPSNHLACLRGCGLVVAVPDGRRSRYELADSRLAHAIDDLVALTLAIDPDAVCAIDAEGDC